MLFDNFSFLDESCTLSKKTGRVPLNNVWNSILTRNTKVTPTLLQTRRKFLERYKRMGWISIYFTAVLMRIVADRSYPKFLQNGLYEKREFSSRWGKFITLTNYAQDVIKVLNYSAKWTSSTSLSNNGFCPICIGF